MDTHETFLNGRREWTDNQRVAAESLRLWQVMGVGSLLILVVSVGWTGYLASSPKFVPYVVTIDRLGTPVAYAPAVRLDAPTEAVMAATLSGVIANLRQVFADGTAQRHVLQQTFGYLNGGDPATLFVEAFIEARAALYAEPDRTVTVHIETAHVIGERTWQVQWREETYARDGLLTGTEDWRATATLYVAKRGPVSASDLLQNPLGLYLETLSWSRVAS